VKLPVPRHGHVFFGAPGTILAYPIDETGSVRMCFDLTVEFGKGRDVAAALLREAYAPFVAEPLRAAMLRAIAERPLEICANHAVVTRACAAPGVAIVGDAGGCSHPLAASGMTIALNDARTLAAALEQARTADAALPRYARQRYQFARARETLSHALYEVFSSKDDGSRLMRSGMLDYWRTSAHARAQSMALLSGQESRLNAFALEYGHVVARSLRRALSPDAVDPRASRVTPVRSVLRLSCGKARQVAASIYRDYTSPIGLASARG